MVSVASVSNGWCAPERNSLPDDAASPVPFRLDIFQNKFNREAFKNYLANFFAKDGGSPIIPLRFFWHNDFSLKGGYPQFR